MFMQSSDLEIRIQITLCIKNATGIVFPSKIRGAQMADSRSVTRLRHENVAGLYVVMDVIYVAVVVHVFEPLCHVYGDLHPRNPGTKDRESGHLAAPQAIRKAQSLDVFVGEIYDMSLAAASQELDYARVVGIVNLSEPCPDISDFSLFLSNSDRHHLPPKNALPDG